jgi:peroxiredoxin
MKKAVLLLTVFLWVLAAARPSFGLDIGDAAKDFALPDAAGGMFTLNEATRGAPATILEFLSAYCEACQKKAPYMNGLFQKYGSQGLRIVAVALANDQQETAGIIKDWAMPYPVIPDPEKKTFYLYGIHKVPQVFVIDGSGVIRYKGNGDDRKDLEKTIEGLLANKSSGSEGLKPGDKAPVLTLTDVQGNPASVQFRNDTEHTVLAFFSESEAEARTLNNLLCGLHGQGSIRIYGILPATFEKKGPALTDSCRIQLLVDRTAQAAQLYGVTRPPEIILLSRSGYVRQRNAPRSAAELADLLRPAIVPGQSLDDKQLAGYLRTAMPQASSIRPIRMGDRETLYIADTSRGKRLARLVKKDILCEVCTNVVFIMTIDENGIYKNITLVNPFELYGKKIDAAAFTRQFIDKSFHEQFALGTNADGITGATKSCAKFIEGLNETGAVLSSLQKPPFKEEFKQAVCFLNQGELEAALRQYQRERGGKSKVDIRDLAPLCPQGKLPQCRAGGTYRMTVFNGISRVLCSEHGLDPRSSMIH